MFKVENAELIEIKKYDGCLALFGNFLVENNLLARLKKSKQTLIDILNNDEEVSCVLAPIGGKVHITELGVVQEGIPIHQAHVDYLK